MNTLSSWEAQTLELIGLIDHDIKETEGQLNSLREEKRALEEALNAYRQRVGARYAQAVQTIRPEEFEGKTLREMLHLIAERNGRIIVVKDAVKLLREAKVFGNPLHADSIIYSILGRSREFVRVGKGIFRLDGLHKESKAKKESVPGLKQAILELKTSNPDMTKNDVANILIRYGFDFQGKSPKRAVHMTWVNMGYAKTEKHKQQNLFREI